MTVDKIVEERWDDEMQSLNWTRESGDETKVYHAQGLDIVIVQTRDGIDYSAWCYSEPGLYLFAAMLKYHQQIGLDIPHIDEIQNLLGTVIPTRECGYPVDRIGMDFILKYDFPVAEQDRIILSPDQMINPVGGHMGGKGYYGFIEDGAFWISVPDSGEKVPVSSERDGKPEEIGALFRTIKLYPGCALNLMKTVNLWYPDKDFLSSVHRQAEEHSEEWIYEGI